MRNLHQGVLCLGNNYSYIPNIDLLFVAFRYQLSIYKSKVKISVNINLAIIFLKTCILKINITKKK